MYCTQFAEIKTKSLEPIQLYVVGNSDTILHFTEHNTVFLLLISISVHYMLHQPILTCLYYQSKQSESYYLITPRG